MIEVLFGESEAASMKAAKHKLLVGRSWNMSGNRTVSPGEEQKKARNQQQGLPGNPSEVICLGFMLDIGDIKESVYSEYRKELICSMFYQEQWGRQNETEFENAWRLYCKELGRLKNFLEHGERVRIWYSSSPYSMCGLYFLCDFLRNYKNTVSVMKLPEHRVKDKCIVSYQNWGEIAAEEFEEFLQYENHLSLEERNLYSIRWAELVEENTPLRAVVNGRLIGVSEEFYDFLIWRRITKTPIKQARLIGDILGYYPISVGDWWYAKRIESFIKAGKIRIVEDSENKYARVICLA